MATRYLVSYDIADPDRLRRVHLVVKAFGAHVQDSVYEALLTAKERVRLEGKLRAVMNLAEDQVIFIDLGDAERRTVDEITSLGLPYAPQNRDSIVV